MEVQFQRKRKEKAPSLLRAWLLSCANKEPQVTHVSGSRGLTLVYVCSAWLSSELWFQQVGSSQIWKVNACCDTDPTFQMYPWQGNGEQ